MKFRIFFFNESNLCWSSPVSFTYQFTHDIRLSSKSRNNVFCLIRSQEKKFKFLKQLIFFLRYVLCVFFKISYHPVKTIFLYFPAGPMNRNFDSIVISTILSISTDVFIVDKYFKIYLPIFVVYVSIKNKGLMIQFEQNKSLKWHLNGYRWCCLRWSHVPIKCLQPFIFFYGVSFTIISLNTPPEQIKNVWCIW